MRQLLASLGSKTGTSFPPSTPSPASRVLPPLRGSAPLASLLSHLPSPVLAQTHTFPGFSSATPSRPFRNPNFSPFSCPASDSDPDQRPISPSILSISATARSKRSADQGVSVSESRSFSVMSLQQVVRPRSSGNGVARRRGDRETSMRSESKVQSGRPSSSGSSNSGHGSSYNIEGSDTPSRDRLVYISACLIGQSVEVHVKNGSVISGIFHASNAEKDFGIVLKMARVTKDGSVKGQKNASDIIKRPQTMIVPSKEFVQLVAKDVPLINDGFSNELVREKRQDLMIDSAISQSHQMEVRELERWVPDDDTPHCPELDNIFDGTWNRNWDQFETNEALFGVKSTFNEELYTTKLERGPKMKEIEREALRIAREIEGEVTEDIHLAEERGLNFHDDFDFDEESRFSAVHRGDSDSYVENDKNTLDSNISGCPLPSVNPISFSQRKDGDIAQASPLCFQKEEEPSQLSARREEPSLSSTDPIRNLFFDSTSNASFNNNRLDKNQPGQQEARENCIDEHPEKNFFKEANESKFQGKPSSPRLKKTCSDKGSLSFPDSIRSPSFGEESQDKDTPIQSSDPTSIGKVPAHSRTVGSHIRPGNSISSTPESACGTSVSAGRVLSPSSSAGSLSSEKSSLNPHAKEFRLNPNAKSFTPTSSSSLRPQSPVSENLFYYPSTGSSIQQMNGVPLGVGVGPSFGGQPFLYNPQGVHMQPPQHFMHSGGPLYGHQMILGQPRPVLYMPTYPPEMPYKGREF